MLQAAQIRGGKRMREIELSAEMIEYEDTGGGGPVVVLLPGLAMDSSLWRHVVRELRGGVAGDPL
jgi:pimeloyl-ACP methyl ester carboxylesterase